MKRPTGKEFFWNLAEIVGVCFSLLLISTYLNKKIQNIDFGIAGTYIAEVSSQKSVNAIFETLEIRSNNSVTITSYFSSDGKPLTMPDKRAFDWKLRYSHLNQSVLDEGIRGSEWIFSIENEKAQSMWQYYFFKTSWEFGTIKGEPANNNEQIIFKRI